MEPRSRRYGSDVGRWWRYLAPDTWASPLEFLPGLFDVFSSKRSGARPPRRRVFIDKNGRVVPQEKRDDS